MIKSQFLDQPSTSGVSFSKLAIDFSFGFSLSNVEHLQVVEKQGFGRIGVLRKKMQARFQKKLRGLPKSRNLLRPATLEDSVCSSTSRFVALNPSTASFAACPVPHSLVWYGCLVPSNILMLQRSLGNSRGVWSQNAS